MLAPLALLLVLEARCTHLVIAHFNYFVLWSSDIIHDDKLVSEHYRDCNGNSSAHVQGRRQLDLVLLLSGLCNTTLTYLPR